MATERLPASSDRVCYCEYLIDRQRGPFIRLVLIGSLDPARVPADEQVVYCGVEDGMHQPVRLGDRSCAHPGILQHLSLLPYGRSLISDSARSPK
jgi:hypothetical protein